jgi:lipopolysaccharide/colanic/teichoic acid biosynthesis glycosyltransferase
MNARRIMDILVAVIALAFTAPVHIIATFMVWIWDRKSPFYVAERIGKGGRPFRMIKLRSMVVGADRTGVDSTSAADPRLTPIGRILRDCKLDELPQFINVLKGDMGLVGPRPNVRRETDLYTAVEKRLLDVSPGLTDMSSIVFSDLGEILRTQADPDLAYNQLVRPGKSRLGLFYIAHRSLIVDIRIIWLTALALLSRRRALRGVQTLLMKLGADEELVGLAGREKSLVPSPPPGADRIVTSRCA